MVHVLNDPSSFADETVAGLAAAYSRYLRAVPGGVVRAQPDHDGRVAVVIGGGSGHYPAFGGLVGPGLAAGAAMGNVFASPSTQQVESVARAAERGGGVLLTFGNYMGDVLNFGAAQEALRASGIECRTVLVTDDVASATADDRGRRRGIAGDLVVFKVAGAAAAEGLSLDEVTEAATRANDRTRTLGVAFSGCTLPGAAEPLFTVTAGTMAVGMGIHGEPGLGDEPLPTADALAGLLVERLLVEDPDPGASGPRRVAVLLNGLGGVKYEALFVLYRRVHELLEQQGLEVVDPEVGELVTSFDMAGVSLSLTWLDDDLARWWSAAAHSPAFRRGGEVVTAGPATVPPRATAEPVVVPATSVDGPSADSLAAAHVVRRSLVAVSAVLDEHADRLGDLDAVAGDGDHGIGMQRGALAAARAVDVDAHGEHGAGTTLRRAGEAWSDRAGGTSGALWGLVLRTLGDEVGDTEPVTTAALARGVCAASDAVRAFGGAAIGDKTLVDALVPFAETLAGDPDSATAIAWDRAAAAAEAAADRTAELLPRVGRARPHAERSVGTPDPGAVSLALVARTVATTLAEGEPTDG